jgi:hypothetical protein
MDFRQLDRGELVAILGGVTLGISVFLDWYKLGNKFAVLNTCRGPNTSCTGWKSLMIIRFLLLVAAAAPAMLAWIIVRGHALSWPRGEMTAIVAIAALTFTVFRGLIDRPGSPSGEISIAFGWWVGLAGGLLILVGSVWRTQESVTTRKPPGLP